MEILDQLFESPNELIADAGDHMQEAKAISDAFFATKPYTRVTYHDKKTAQDIYKVRLVGDPPTKKLTRLVKNATASLRDALDHAVYASAKALTGAEDPDHTGFPFGDTPERVDCEVASKRLSGNPPEIRPFLVGLNPHKAGYPVLWGLNRIRNPNTHRALIKVGAYAVESQSTFRPPPFVNLAGCKFGYGDWDPAKNELEFLRVPHGLRFDYDIEFAFCITFGNVEVFRDKEFLMCLTAMTSEVECVVSGIKAETARILRERNP